MLNPVHLRTLVEVVQLGSFAGAANRLGYTASAVSQQMTALEQLVGVPLFERTARSAHPTEAARAMARRALPLFADFDAILDAARNAHDGTVKDVTLTIYASLARAVLRPLLNDPELSDAGVRLRVSVQDPSAAVRSIIGSEPPDITFVYRYSGSGLAWPPAVQQLDFGIDRYRVIAPAQWNLPTAGERHPSPGVLSQLPWALHHPGSSDANVIDSAFRKAGIHPRVMGHSDSFDVVLELVAAGAAAAFVPETVAQIAPAGVVILDAPGLQLARDVHALVSPSAPRLATLAVLAALRRALPLVRDPGAELLER